MLDVDVYVLMYVGADADVDVDANANVDVDATRYAAATDDARSTNANVNARHGPKHDDVNVTARATVRWYGNANAAAWRSNRRLRLRSQTISNQAEEI